MMKYEKLIIFVILFFPSFVWSFFCPTNFSQIDYGFTMDQVIKICGKPDKQETKIIPAEGPQEWSYYIPQTVGSNTLTPMQGTLKTQVTFDSNGKAINISVNGIGVGSTTICGGALIQLGDDRDRIKSICGDPSFVNKQNGNATALGGGTPPTKRTTFTYNTTPPATLIFENGQLKEKQ